MNEMILAGNRTYEKDYTLLKDDNAFNFKVSTYIIRFKKYIKEFNA